MWERLAGISCEISYRFVGDKLVNAGYVFTETHTNEADFFSDFDTISDLLTEKYGKPAKAGTTWKNNLYREQAQYWGTARNMGHVEKVANWSTASTDITLSLDGDNFNDNFKITFELCYIGKQFKDLVDKTCGKKAKDQL